LDLGGGRTNLGPGGDRAVAGEDAPHRGKGDGPLLVKTQVPWQGVSAGAASGYV